MSTDPKILPNPDNSVRIEDDFEPETHVVYAESNTGNTIQIFGYGFHIPDSVAFEDAVEVK